MSSDDDVAIRVSNLSKRYEIYANPGDRLKQFVLPRLQRLLGMTPKQYFREFWALKDVSFEVKQGETVGIIGRNGSGKSTLLQMICGTLSPTEGSIQTNGRIAALLELGSGFNPEFTGRENVYMNASVLGLSAGEIDARFEAIRAFSDIGEFIDEPVKTYSSGMAVRLAFAVIAHVDADILIVDEALSVGDAMFTQKCMGFIRDFQKRGTLLFVSHDLGSVQNLCKTCMWLGHGSNQMIGTSKDVAEAYLEYALQQTYGTNAKLKNIKQLDPNYPSGNTKIDRSITTPTPFINYESKLEVQNNLIEATGWKTGIADLLSIELTRPDGAGDKIFLGGEKVRIIIRAKAKQALVRPIIGFTVRDRLGQELFGENTLPFTDLNPVPVNADQVFFAEFHFQIPMLPNGQYAVMASLAEGNLYENIQHHFMHDALIITVSSSKIRWGLVGISFDSVSLKVLT